MKKTILFFTIFALSHHLFAQNADLRRKIEVSGVAQKEVTPDIINVSVSLKEYMNGKNKVTIEELEGELQNAVKDGGIAKEDFTINDISGYNNYFQKKKDPGFLAGKQYTIRFHELGKFNEILARVDPKGIESTEIESYDYSKMVELKRELKTQALLAARDKAVYLLTSINEKLGDALSITEVDNSSYENPAMENRLLVSNVAKLDASENTVIDFKKIKLSFQINAVFEIVK